jgi:hypothetical protein
MTLSELATKIAISSKLGSSVAFDRMDDWQKKANAYRVTLRYQRRTMTIDWWQGTGIADDPDAASVISALLSDANAGAGTFEEFCSDMGYDSDSRKAEKTWRACKRINPQIRRLLGADFDQFANAENDV